MVHHPLVALPCAVLLGACGAAPPPAAAPEAAQSSAPPPTATGFVQARDQQLWLNEQRYTFVGVNLWYGAYLAAPGDTGNLERLRTELDLLKSSGVTNVRVLGASEDGPMKNSVKPSFRGPTDAYNAALLQGLDVLLAELGPREMKAVIYLNNFWEWSGGMGTYLSWVNGGQFVDMADPTQPWPAYPLFTMQFYDNVEANALFRDYVQAVVTRTNSVTGTAYAKDPAIMAWQLANEPRPGNDTSPGHHVFPAFYRWVDETAAFIKALDPTHLVSSGNEGVMGCAGHVPCFLDAHETPHIDYLTIHVWPKNWGWLADEDMSGTLERSLARTREYIDQHLGFAATLGKPLVIEEFGLPRDGGSLTPGSPTVLRDRYHAALYHQVEDSARAGGALCGSNVWSWGGLGRAERPDGQWQTNDRQYTGDPPQEPQGLNSIFDVDTSTLDVMSTHARELREATLATAARAD